MKGKVYLVGAGPGDPDLLTVKAVRLLKSADIVLHDDLVSKEILGLVSVKTELRNVGKRCGAKRISQTEINFLTIALAESGLDVIRLKSGDPLIFGRSGEEIEALRHAGIDFEVVPGVTAALAAAAATQIPLTHREVSHALVFVSGNSAEGHERADWKQLVGSGATLAIYMPGRDYWALAQRLMGAGISTGTSCAVVSAASTSNQKIVVTTVGALPDSPDLPSPSLLIVGEVGRFAQASEAQAASELPTLFPELRQFMADEEIV